MAEYEKEVVTCPNCSSDVAYADLNVHLDNCLGLKEQKRQTTFKREEGPITKRSRVNEKPSNGAPVTTTSQTFTTPSKSASSVATTSRERLNNVAPLAERLRPTSLDDFVGQSQVVDGPLKALIKRGSIPNMILWGPPGTGKTTLARILARTTHTQATGPYRFVEISATTASTNDVKKVFDEAFSRLQLTGQRTVLFIDEIQRFSRAQQDVFLPMIEKGHLILIAATTENPSFRLQGALLSRMRVFVLTKLSIEECFQVLRRARERVKEDDEEREEEENGQEGNELAEDEVLRWIATMADGDARTALSTLELALVTLQKDMSIEEKLKCLRENLKRSSLQYDRTGDHHYDTISALHKSIRGSNADAALYWLARMVESGDDPLFIARRMIVAASEDCNTLEALQMATSTYSACQVVGLPECAENLAQCVVFLAESSKSTRSYRGWKKAQALVKDSYNYPVPIHIRNAPTKLLKELGHGKEYHYEPNFAHPIHQEYFPPELKSTRLLSPPPLEDDKGEVEESKENSVMTDGVDGNIRHSDRSSLLMPSSAAVGPGSCQRIFSLGARSVDLDLLDVWEKERNGGKEWSGRRKLMQQIKAAQSSHPPSNGS